MEPPSPALSAALRDLRLATPRDLRRAAARCRSIARDLPAFDCVWIDALLGLRRITPFQAERLQDGEAHLLRIGPYVLLGRLGGGVDCTTYLARPLDGGPRCVLKELAVPADRRVAVRARLEEQCAAARSLRSPHVIVPDAVREEGERLVVVSRFADGRDARAWLMRCGRLRPAAVAEIARQLLAAVAEAHRLGLRHGEIRLSNLHLARRGDAVLVDHGIRSAVCPGLPIDDSRPPEWYDGTAPERIGTAEPATAASDAYALGCLLWQLLAGRPPFATGDPLAKLTAHRMRPIPDVRDYAADVPPELARLIAEMTDLDASRRPSDLRAAGRRLRQGTRPGRSLLRKPITGSPDGRFPWPIAAAAVFALAGASHSLLDRGATAALLKASFGTAAAESRTAARAAAPTSAALPPPDETGVVALEHAGPFAAADVSFRGPLALRGRPERPATIVVTDRPLHLWADEVTLEHVRVLHSSAGSLAGSPPALVLVEAQNLSIRSCRFEAPIRPATERAAAPTAVAWRLIDRVDSTAGRLEMRDAVFHGGREAVFADQLRRAVAENVLAVGQRSFLSLGKTDATAVLKNLTIRETGTVVACRAGSKPIRIEVTAEDSILDLGPDGALFTSSVGAADVRWSGTGVVTAHGLRAPAETSARVEGVSPADVTFAGRATGSDAASVARVSGAPRVAGRAPGIDLSRLPREVVGPGGSR